jgi:hypothetical protein
MLAASFFSDQAVDVRYWPKADMTCFLGTAHRAFLSWLSQRPAKNAQTISSFASDAQDR